jgi:hypothetical protein
VVNEAFLLVEQLQRAIDVQHKIDVLSGNLYGISNVTVWDESLFVILNSLLLFTRWLECLKIDNCYNFFKKFKYNLLVFDLVDSLQISLIIASRCLHGIQLYERKEKVLALERLPKYVSVLKADKKLFGECLTCCINDYN